MSQPIIVYTDGACHGNPGPGGWGAIVRFDDGQETELYGGDPATTNNRMELMAAIMALETIAAAGAPVQLWTDSQYVRSGITGWITGWKRNGWRTAARQPVKNADLWQRLDAAASGLSVDWRWVKGHAGHEGNELADALATRGAIEHGGSTRQGVGAARPAVRTARRGRQSPRRRGGGSAHRAP